MSLGPRLAELHTRIPRGMRLNEASLDAMRAACATLGNPERAFPAVHVAGTNGKGSVCAMVESIARAAGKKTGLYTSPHLVRFAERIRVDGEPIRDDVLEDVLAEALAIEPELSFFETTTLAAFLAFRDAKVDLAILEVGLGGRLDATNVIPPPLVTAVTSIAFDHMDLLGNTLTAIAREKAAIAKPGVPMVLGELEPEVRLAIDQVAIANGATTESADDEAAQTFLRGLRDFGLRGLHQWPNATVAYAIAKRLGIDDRAITEGLQRVRWPGRLEWVDTAHGLVILDGAHNPDGARVLARYVHGCGRPVALVFGALADKQWPAMLDTLAPLTTHRVYVRPQGRAAAEPADLVARHPGRVAATIPEGLARARADVGERGIVVVCGSLYLVGEARAELLGLARDPIVAL